MRQIRQPFINQHNNKSIDCFFSSAFAGLALFIDYLSCPYRQIGRPCVFTLKESSTCQTCNWSLLLKLAGLFFTVCNKTWFIELLSEVVLYSWVLKISFILRVREAVLPFFQFQSLSVMAKITKNAEAYILELMLVGPPKTTTPRPPPPPPPELVGIKVLEV